jgi:Putative carbonic anhydrase
MDLNAHPGDGDFDSTVRFTPARIGAAAVYCSDGRFGEQVDQFLHDGLGLPRYDRLAVPGGPACLAGHFGAYRQEEGLVEHLRFLVQVHGLQRVVLIAHQGCAFYLEHLRVHEIDLIGRQCDDLNKAVRRVLSIDSRLMIQPYFAVLRGDLVRFRPLDDLRQELDARG